jgi:hypothetical protein
MQRALRSVRHNSWRWLTPVHEMLKFAQDLKTCRKIAFARVSPHPVFELMSSTSPQALNSRPTLGTMGTRFPATVRVVSPPVAVVIIAFEIRVRSSPRMSLWRPGGSSRSSGRWSEIAGEQPCPTSLISSAVWAVQATRAYRQAATRRRGRQTRRRSRWTQPRWPVGRLLSTKK